MLGFDERLKSGLDGIAEQGDPTGAFDRVVARKSRRRLKRRMDLTLLATLVLAATGTGTFVLVKAFWPAPPTTVGRQLPSNGDIAFTGYVEPASGCLTCTQVKVMHSDGTGVRLVAPSRWEQSSPAWSPDGSQLAFVQRVPNKGARDIWVIGADGTGLKALTHCRFPDCDYIWGPAWSPDGTKIAFFQSLSRGQSGIYVMNADGSDPKLLVKSSATSAPAWSPDGKLVAFEDQVSEHLTALEVIGSDGSDRRILTRLQLLNEDCHFDCYNGDPAWSPDGKRIVFVHLNAHAYAGVSHIYIIDVDGSGVRRLLHCRCPHVGDPAWSPDGRKILFSRSGQIFVADADGTHIRKVPSGRRSASAPSWQPVPASRANRGARGRVWSP